MLGEFTESAIETIFIDWPVNFAGYIHFSSKTSPGFGRSFRCKIDMAQWNEKRFVLDIKEPWISTGDNLYYITCETFLINQS